MQPVSSSELCTVLPCLPPGHISPGPKLQDVSSDAVVYHCDKPCSWGASRRRGVAEPETERCIWLEQQRQLVVWAGVQAKAK
jgi:hypothetical protein